MQRSVILTVSIVSSIIAAMRKAGEKRSVRNAAGAKSDAGADAARAAAEVLHLLPAAANGLALVVGTAGKKQARIEIPVAALPGIRRALEQVARQPGAALDMTTQQAADLLGVSRPHVVKLLKDGKLAYRKVGSHRRLRRADVEAFRKASIVERTQALDELAELSQDMRLYDL